jgi:hypothetical protein
MPQGAQSLIPYNQTIFTAVNGTQYKGGIDADTSIAANIAGAFYVYPNSPAAMNVLVDPGYTYWQVGTGAVLNEAGSPVTVAIPAPGSGTYIATVYWDLITNTAGAVFSAIGGNPIMPEQINQIPMAFVTVTSVTTSITAAIIQDCRSLAFCSAALQKAIGVVATNQTLNCSGARSVSASLSITTAVAISLTLTNLQVGVPVNIRFDNAQATSENFKVIASTPAGVAYSVIGKNPNSTSVNLTSIGMTASGNTTFLLTYGGSYAAGTLNFVIA